MDLFFTIKANWHVQLAFNGTSVKVDISEKDDFNEIGIYDNQF